MKVVSGFRGANFWVFESDGDDWREKEPENLTDQKSFPNYGPVENKEQAYREKSPTLLTTSSLSCKSL